MRQEIVPAVVIQMCVSGTDQQNTERLNLKVQGGGQKTNHRQEKAGK